ncbi:MAG: hypothetical protein methR_P0349 [Methyloprofundus sp.]|nr:MAG: hypothetical protein methR_P0349 [Methyloprofundus sp.]
MFHIRIILLLTTFITIPAPLIAQTNGSAWQLAKEQQGIKVYTRTIAGSKFKEFKGEVEISSSIDSLLSFINNAEYCPQWRYKCMQMMSLSEGYIYKLSNLPWPLSDRYTVMSSQLLINAAQNIYTLQLKNIKREQLPQHILAQLPAAGSTVQMHSSDGYWQFKLSSPTSIHITYQMHGDPAGVLPAALANQGVTNAAFVTLLNLKKHFSATGRRGF